MMRHKKIQVGRKTLQAICFNLSDKNLIAIRGKRGYIMCGYLNLEAAEKFKEAAVKITGVSTIGQALDAKVHSLTTEAKKLGIHKNQPIRDVLKIIA